MAYAIPEDWQNPNAGVWRRLRWPAPKLANGWLVRPGTQGATAALLASVGAVEIVVPEPTPGTDQVVDTTTLTDVDGTPTLAYTYRDLTAEEIAARDDAADRDAKRANVANALATLRSWADDMDTRADQMAGVTATTSNAVNVLNQLIDVLEVDFRRTSTFYDRFADLIEAQRIDIGGNS